MRVGHQSKEWSNGASTLVTLFSQRLRGSHGPGAVSRGGVGLMLLAGCMGVLGGCGTDYFGATDAATGSSDAAIAADGSSVGDAAMPADGGAPIPETCETDAALVTPTDVTFGRIKPGASVRQGFSSAHSGIDFVGGNAEVQASSDGFVVARRTSSGAPEVVPGFSLPSQASGGCWGNFVAILHGRTSGGRVRISWYAHLASVGLALGQSVQRGEVVGVAGASSYTSCGVTGVHLHYSVTLDGSIVDPTPYYGTATGNANVSMRWHWSPPDSTTQHSIDQALSDAGYEAGTGSHWGRTTIEAIQRVLTDHAGFTGAVDGVPDGSTAEFVQRFAAGCGGYTGPINAVPGTNTWDAFEAALGAL